MQPSTRVAVNTIVQYGRTIVSVCLALYSSRLVLDSLGVSDYGIYSLIAGVIAMLSFLRSSLATTTQRFLSFNQGKGKIETQKRIFGTSLLLHVGLSILLGIIVEIIGYFLFDGFLNIPEDRIYSAKIIYHFMVLTLFLTMLSTPFYATLIAHENIIYTSIIQTLNAILKLFIAISLSFVSSDKLIFYGFLISIIDLVNLLMYSIYCLRRFEECSLTNLRLNKGILIKLVSFAGWTIYSSACIVGRTQGVAVLLNKFFNTAINTAYGLAQQVIGQLSFLSGSLIQAINPQIVKAEGASDRNRMLRLSEITSKFSFFLLSIIAIPCIFEMPVILSLWLKEVPEYTITFCRLIFIAGMLDQLTIGLGYANQAIGNIRNYSLIINSIKLLTLPVSYVLLRNGFQPGIVMISYVFFEGICSLARLPFLKKTAGLSIKSFVYRVFLREITSIGICVLTCLLIYTYCNWEYRFLITFIFSSGLMGLSIYFTGLCTDEKLILFKLLTFVKFHGSKKNY